MEVSILVITISNPILIGVYKNNALIEKFENDGKTSDVLPKILLEISYKYSILEICYVNSPGSFMSIKLAYITLKSFCIVKQIPLYAISGFYFNNNSPIKALGKKYFKNVNNKVKIEFLNADEKIEKFVLPNILDERIFSEDSLPKYHISAI